MILIYLASCFAASRHDSCLASCFEIPPSFSCTRLGHSSGDISQDRFDFDEPDTAEAGFSGTRSSTFRIGTSKAGSSLTRMPTQPRSEAVGNCNEHPASVGIPLSSLMRGRSESPQPAAREFDGQDHCPFAILQQRR